MAVYEHVGLLTYKDKSGNKHLMYPITKAECIDELETATVGNADKLGNHEPSYFAKSVGSPYIVSIDDGGNNTESSVETDDFVPVNADKLGNHEPSYFATSQSVIDIVDGKTKVAKSSNADKLNGYDSSSFVNSLSQYIGSSETILEWATTPNGIYKKFVIDSQGYPEDLPIKSEGYLELLIDSEQRRKRVIYQPWQSRAIYCRDMWIGAWKNEWFRLDGLSYNGGTVKGNITLQSTDSVERHIQLTNLLHSGITTVTNTGRFGLFSNTNNKWIIGSDVDGNVVIDGENYPLHTGNSKSIHIGSSAPTNTSSMWYDTTNKLWKYYKDGAWQQ